MIEHIISIFAPHHCLGCGIDDNRLICSKCQSSIKSYNPICYRCDRAAEKGLCGTCRKISPLTRVQIRARYQGLAKAILWKLKFDRAKSAAREIAQLLPTPIVALPENVLIVPLPTATSRIRHRGYDQAVLIAQAFAKRYQLSYADLLIRTGQSRQVGATRTQRQQYAARLYRLKEADVQHMHIILIDDVITTGSSFEAAARLLLAAGASSVQALAFAHADPMAKW